MNFYKDAIATLETLVRAVNSQYGLRGWERRKCWPPEKVFNRPQAIPRSGAQFLSNRRKLNPCNKLIRQSAV